MAFDFLQHQTSRLQRCSFGRERREPGGDQVGVDEDRAVRFIRQKFTRKGGFSRTVWPRNDDDAQILAHRQSSNGAYFAGAGLTCPQALQVRWSCER